MRFSDPSLVHRLTFLRIKSDAAGAAVRALLGSTTLSIIAATELNKAALPPRPFLAYKPGGCENLGGIDVHSASWWIYDDPAQGTWRIDLVAAALPAAYLFERGAPPLPSPAGPVRVVALAEPRDDLALGLRHRRLDLTVDA